MAPDGTVAFILVIKVRNTTKTTKSEIVNEASYMFIIKEMAKDTQIAAPPRFSVQPRHVTPDEITFGTLFSSKQSISDGNTTLEPPVMNAIKLKSEMDLNNEIQDTPKL